MTPRTVAIVSAVISVTVLGVALAQIMPADRARLPAGTVPPAQDNATPLRPTIRDVTPQARETPPAAAETAPPAASAPATPPAPAPAGATPPSRSAAPGPAAPARPAGPRRPAPVSVEILPDNEDLKDRVGHMREKLILAARSGDIERLGVVFQMNETMPVFSRGGERDPIAFWKQASGDGQGHEILAILLNILDLPPAVINKGTPQEMTVWPYLAHVPLDRLTPRQSVDLYRLMTAQDVRDMRALNAWVFWRLGIGPDGTLHYFLAGE
ncbi:hypothetical protein [Phreatobacter sp. AB_2022a]|uniref:hypothetical protein n=1 Tax=Phreatobacter sp. AB_2022a TaxID=3003134 RepID=UPI002286DC83|nr:hypothetical protein [Phreatobacter sp. AB_2022a]MCZ0733359.1 hypothetical protein [Phreatobacter sp. AB_2022a]